jgi:hypothetical protein
VTSSPNELIFLCFWPFAQIFDNYARPAVSKRGLMIGLSPAGKRELEIFYHKDPQDCWLVTPVVAGLGLVVVEKT